MGSLLRLPVFEGGDAKSTVVSLRQKGFSIAACVPRGGVDFRNADLKRELALVLGSESHGLPEEILAETDAPYLSPHPIRKIRRNEPAHLVHTVECLAKVRGVSAGNLADQTYRNAQQLFGVE